MPGEQPAVQTSFQNLLAAIESTSFDRSFKAYLHASLYLADEIQDFSNNCIQHSGDREKRKLSFFSKDTPLIHRA